MVRFAWMLTIVVFGLLGFVDAQVPSFPVRALHLSAPAPEDVPLLASFIRDALPREGANVLVLEINYRYQFVSHPELRDENALSREQVQELVRACRDAGVQLVPLFNCLGHQSWKSRTAPLLVKYPEFDEAPGLYPDNQGIYCRSYCPRHPKIHEVLFSLFDELIEVFEAKAFHTGMDEVFLLGEDACPRCRGAAKAELFAEEVNTLQRYLAGKKLATWIWGDRLIDGRAAAVGEWEGSANQTERAIGLISKDVVICDWHYESAPPTAAYFAVNGFNVISCPWKDDQVALGQLNWLKLGRDPTNRDLASRFQGVLQTTWCNANAFIRAYYGRLTNAEMTSDSFASARQTAGTFKRLFAAMRPR